MKSHWHNYPWSLFTAAFATTAGGVLTLILCLDVAAASALWVISDEFIEPSLFLIVGFGPICLACIQLWGFAYLLLLMWFLHRLIFQGSSRLMCAMILVPAHFVVSFTMFLILDDWYWDAEVLYRAIAVLFVLVLPLAWSLVVHRLQRKRIQHSQQKDGQLSSQPAPCASSDEVSS